MSTEMTTSTLDNHNVALNQEPQVPSYPKANKPASGQRIPFDRLMDVHVVIKVELGNTTTTLGELMNYGVGAVIELDRQVDDFVDIIAQETKIAKGEVMVIDDRFAVRITELYAMQTPDKATQ